MIRPTVPTDIPQLLTLTADTGVFKPHEVETLQEVLEDYFATNQNFGHVCVLEEHAGEVIGYAYYAPASMTDRSWYLYWIAVAPKSQGQGVGTALMHYTEEDIRARQGRLLWIETSSLPSYEPTRRFYLRHGYEVSAVLRDFYREGDDMVVFRKRISG